MLSAGVQLGSLCTAGSLPNLTRVFYYCASPHLLIEVIDRRQRSLKHLVMLVDEEGEPVPIPPGARFVHVESDADRDLLDIYVRRLSRSHDDEAKSEGQG